MSLSPRDISAHEFSRTMRGYDPDEVRAFLERVSDDVYELQKQLNALTRQNTESKARLDTLEKEWRESAGASASQTDQERERILHEAKLEAAQVKLALERDAQALREELHGLKLQRDGFVKRFKLLLQSQTELLDLLENEPPEITDARSENATR